MIYIYLLKFGFLNDVVTSLRQMVGRLVNNELEWMWKEVVVVNFQLLSQHLAG
jgi:hypothetical protein